MIDTLRKFLDLLDGRERRRFYLLLGALCAMAFANMVGVASIIPFLTVLGDPEGLRDEGLLGDLYRRSGLDSEDAFLFALGILVAIMFQMTVLVRIVTTYLLARFAHFRSFTISRRVISGYVAQPYGWFVTRHTADMVKNLMAETSQVVNGAIIPLLEVIANGLIVLFLVVLLLVTDWQVALTMASIISVSFGGIFLIVRGPLRRSGDRRVKMNRARFRAAHETLNGIKEIKVLGVEERAVARYAEPAQRFARQMATSMMLSQIPQQFLEGLTFVIAIAAMLFLFAENDGDLGALLPVIGLYAAAGVRLLPATKIMFQCASRIRFCKPTLDALHKEYMTVARQAVRYEPGAKVSFGEAIELRDVHYRYPESDALVLRGLDMRIPALSSVGIVGGTGAGKTTALDILLGLLEPERGALLVDGVDIKGDALRRGWRSRIGYVPQSIHLYAGSFAANIALGQRDDEIDMAAVERAAKLAQLHDFVMGETPFGYGTDVGDKGVKLSGGQRQRIGIARALYRRPSVLVLDEATASLDPTTERAFMEAVASLGGHMTIIMVAHRLTTVRACDTIFLLERGRVVAEGDFAQLVEGNAVFRELAQGIA